MEVPGFTLLLQDFCGYCPDFDAEVDTFDCKSLGGLQKRPTVFGAGTAAVVPGLQKI